MDATGVRKLADSAADRARTAHAEYGKAVDAIEMIEAHKHLNDFFYWIGHANAYRGIAAQIDFMTVVEDEMEAEGSCP